MSIQLSAPGPFSLLPSPITATLLPLSPAIKIPEQPLHPMTDEENASILLQQKFSALGQPKS